MSEGNQDKREDPQDLQSDRTPTDNESGDPARLAPANSRLTDVPAGVIAAVAVHGLLFFALFNVFQWNTDTETVYAELWAPEDASGMSLKGTAQETEEEAAEDDGEHPAFTPAEVRSALVEARRNGVNVTDILKEFGVESFPAFPESRYWELMERVKRVQA